MKSIAIYYIDDIIIPSTDEKQGIERLKLVLQLAKEYSLELKKKKCQFLKRRVKFLGFIIEDGKVKLSMNDTSYTKLSTANYLQTTTIVFRINGLF